MRRRSLWVLLCLPLLAACPKQSSSVQSSGAQPASGDAWVVFEIFEVATGAALQAAVWPKGNREDFDTVAQGEVGASTRFEGIGRRAGGYALPFEPGVTAELNVWSPGYELMSVSQKIKKGENLIVVKMRRTQVEDKTLPPKIRIWADEVLPGEGAKSGT